VAMGQTRQRRAVPSVAGQLTLDLPGLHLPTQLPAPPRDARVRPYPVSRERPPVEWVRRRGCWRPGTPTAVRQ